jgi:Uma2 family endonuclease
MTRATLVTPVTATRPDHTQLPDKDGMPVRNTLEPYQSALLTESLTPTLNIQYPAADYYIGQDTGIYWRETNPPERGCKAPDWYLVLGVPHLLDGVMRRSYVLWQELIWPLLTLEYVSGDGTEERDRTPWEGKYWVYENVIGTSYYGIYEPERGVVELYQRVGPRFQPMQPNGHGRYPIPVLGVELGIWEGNVGGYEMPWLRWWDAQGQLLRSPVELAAEESERAERFAAKLRELGVDPNSL